MYARMNIKTCIVFNCRVYTVVIHLPLIVADHGDRYLAG